MFSGDVSWELNVSVNLAKEKNLLVIYFSNQLLAEHPGQPLVLRPPPPLLLKLVLFLSQESLDVLLTGRPLCLIQHPLLFCQLTSHINYYYSALLFLIRLRYIFSFGERVGCANQSAAPSK